MPAPTVDAESREPSAADSGPTAPSVCGHRWADETACRSGTEHSCARTSPDHRSHLCTCEAVELRTATHKRVSSSRPPASAAALKL
jgi:hypothetical protein